MGNPESTGHPSPPDLARLAHEIRTPLGAIAAMAEVMRDERLGPMPDERYRGYASDIHDSAQHVMQVLSAALASPGAAMMTAGLHPVDLAPGPVLAQLASSLTSMAERKGVRLVTRLQANTARVRIDERALRQTVLNLVSNALRFTPPGGTVTIGAGNETATTVVLSVADTGDGMAPDTLSRIRAREAATPTRGSGLGLPLVRTLVALSGGELTFDSAPGAGTRIGIRLPAL